MIIFLTRLLDTVHIMTHIPVIRYVLRDTIATTTQMVMETIMVQMTHGSILTESSVVTGIR